MKFRPITTILIVLLIFLALPPTSKAAQQSSIKRNKGPRKTTQQAKTKITHKGTHTGKRSIASALPSAPPIKDSEWKEIAGPHLLENYKILKGDTLSEISKKLFGELKYWPKIWSLNNDHIKNPHLILPGLNMRFDPALSPINLKSGVEVANNSKSKTRSTEWKHLPKQSWELYQVPKDTEIDPLGIDESSKIAHSRPSGFSLQTFPATEKIQFVGQIIGARNESEYLGLQDVVYIRSDEGVQIGETYTITQEPTILKAPNSDRVGFSYLNIGKVQILGVRDNLFLGVIVTAKFPIQRGHSLILTPPEIPYLSPIPGPRPIRGVLMIDHTIATYAIAQHKEVFIDRGSEDGVQSGMVFRAYQHTDPGNNKELTRSDFIIDADIQIARVSSNFSSGVVIESKSIINENSEVYLLTDVSDILKNKGFREKGEPDSALNELDSLDETDTLGPKEKKELKQLERWKSNPSDVQEPGAAVLDTTPPPPAPAPTNSGDAPAFVPAGPAIEVPANTPPGAAIEAPLIETPPLEGSSPATADPVENTSSEAESNSNPNSEESDSDGGEPPLPEPPMPTLE
jgi:hypothetical protein